MVDPIGEPDVAQGAERASAPVPAAQAGIGERQLDVGQRARARDQVEALKDEADLAIAQVGEVVLVGRRARRCR